MKHAITLHFSVSVRKPREAVWDFTQDYSLRMKWDKSVIEATVMNATTPRTVRLRMRGGTSMTFVYKQDEKPYKTSLAAIDVQSSIIQSAGGSWRYEENDHGTLWSQTNTLVFRNTPLVRLLLPVLKWSVSRQIKRSMRNAKQIMEGLPR